MPSTELLAHYHRLVLIRRFEERLDELFATGRIPGTAHLCIGQEACAVGAVAALQPGDLVTSNHRGHGHFLALGADPRRVMAEIMGKATGYCGGRGGSQHLSCPEMGFLGANGITGGMIPVATGAALGLAMGHGSWVTGHRPGSDASEITPPFREGDKGVGAVSRPLTPDPMTLRPVVLCFFGDGATGTGAFHEGVNLGAIWQLPIVYFCENNGYAMSTPLAEAFRLSSIAQRAEAYGIPGVQVDGNDYFAVREGTEAAVTRAREGGGPTLIEALTWRQCGHSKSDECEYRSGAEEAEWLVRDPLPRMRKALLERGAAEEELFEAERFAVEEIIASVEFAAMSPDPEP